jgi:thiol-disulfide isomerase/thioredoxin
MRSLVGAVAVITVLFAVPTSSALAQPGTQYRGQLEAEPLPTGTIGGTKLQLLGTTEVPALPRGFQPSSFVYGGQIAWAAAGRGGKVAVIVSEVKPGKRFACLDLNGDGRYETSECKFFVPGTQESASDPEARFSVPTRVGPFRRLPLIVTSPSSADASNDDRCREIQYTGWVYARGRVNIAGRQTLVTFDVSLARGGLIDPRNTTVGLDANGNDKLEGNVAPFESSVAEDEDVVFKVGSRCVRVKSVDPSSGQVTLEERPASEYITIDRVIGARIPDFAFTDFNGEERRLSDFAGKFVLLDFWGTWCGPCIREFPFLKAAYEKLRQRGFEILGIDYEHGDRSPGFADSLEKARTLVASQGVTWPQATTASTRDLTAKRFRVQGFPTALLIGPDGTLRSTGENRSLRGENLLPTLEALIPLR